MTLEQRDRENYKLGRKLGRKMERNKAIQFMLELGFSEDKLLEHYSKEDIEDAKKIKYL